MKNKKNAVTKKAITKKKVAKKKTVLKKKAAVRALATDGPRNFRPVCLNETRRLGGWMTETEANAIADAHFNDTDPHHVTDVEER